MARFSYSPAVLLEHSDSRTLNLVFGFKHCVYVIRLHRTVFYALIWQPCTTKIRCEGLWSVHIQASAGCMVEIVGLEPTTHCLHSSLASQLRHISFCIGCVQQPMLGRDSCIQSSFPYALVGVTGFEPAIT